MACSLSLAGCGLDDRAVVECRCTPQSNLNLFPACPQFTAVLPYEGGEWWITSDGDTLDAEREWITVKGDRRSRGRISSSNPFSPGLPDCPVGPRLMLNEPTRPFLVLFNLRSIFLAQPEARNLDQYMDQLSEDFTFIPDPEDVELHPEVYDAHRDTLWNREQERRFAQAILDPVRVGLITFSRWFESSKDQRITSADQLQETFMFPYEGSLILKGRDGEEDTMIAFRGFMELDMITPTLENPVWTVHQWRDFRDPASAKRSWGELRAEFAR